LTTQAAKEPFRLRLCCFIDMKTAEKPWVHFQQRFACRFITVMFTDRLLTETKEEHPNYDMQTIYFQGSIIQNIFMDSFLATLNLIA